MHVTQKLLTCDAYAFIEQLHELLFRILKNHRTLDGYLRSQAAIVSFSRSPAKLPPHCPRTVQALALRTGMPPTELELVPTP